MKIKLILLFILVNAIVFSKNYHIDLIIKKYSEKYNIDYKLVMALIKIESNFYIYARTKNISCKGYSHGLMQLNDKNYNWKIEDFYNPYINVNEGCRILSECFKMANGDLEITLIYYNFGYGNYRKSRGKIPKITKDYVIKVLKEYQILKNK